MNVKKISISIIIILLLSNIILIPKTFAIADIIKQGDNFLSAEDDENDVINTDHVKNTSSEIYNILLACGIGVAVIVGAILGIHFILSSAEGKAKILETLVPYIVGCFVVFGAFTIWSIVINMGNSIKQTKTLEDVRYEISNRNKQIEEGKIDLMTISEEELKTIYTTNEIDTTLNQKVNGLRGGKRYTIDEAVAELGDTNKKIWEACYKRELLDEEGIWIKK